MHQHSQVAVEALCPLCGSGTKHAFDGLSWEIALNTRSFRYRECKDCGLMFCDPLPSADELGEFYRMGFDYTWYERRWKLKKIQGWHRWKRICHEKLIDCGQAGRVLDVGCGHGWFLNAARNAGWDATGVDLPSAATDFAIQHLNLKIIAGTIDEVEADQRFDLITFWHTLEHLVDPLKAIRAASCLLQPQGQLLIAVPNKEALGLALKKHRWVWLQPPFLHIWHFTTTALRRLLELCRLSVVRAKTRDTWDAQLFYDGSFVSYLHSHYVTDMLNVSKNLLRSIKLPILAKILDTGYFWLTESLRLGLYIAYLIIRPFLPKRIKSRGSELILVAVKTS
jgi:SAM-dependent methyltransferase